MKNLMEAISKQFKDTELFTEEFQNSLKAELEKAINEKVETAVTEKEAILKQSYDEKLVEITEEGQTKLDDYTKTHATKMNEYITEAVNEFAEKNEIAVDAGIRVERANTLVEGIKALMKENDIAITEDVNDIVTDLETANAALKDTNERVINEKAEAIAQSFEYQKVISYNKITEGLTDVQKDEAVKIQTGMVSNTIDGFERNLKIIVEKVKDTKEKNINEDGTKITDSLTHTDKKNGNGNVDHLL